MSVDNANLFWYIRTQIRRSVTTKSLRRAESAQQIAQETIFEVTFPAGVQKNISPQGLIWKSS